MSPIVNRSSPVVSPEELAQIGNGAVSYIRELEGREVMPLLEGHALEVDPDDKLYCLFNANGAPISVSGTREAAAQSAAEHELVAISLH